MKNEKDALDALFGKFQNDWDLHEPEHNHEDRFRERLKSRNGKRYWIPLTIAASLLLLIGLFNFPGSKSQPSGLELASVQTREMDSVFSSAIRVELEKVKQKSTPETKKIIDDAMLQMKAMDADYEKIKQELIKNGESEQIIHAMILNLQTRISFLQNILLQIEKNHTLNLKHDKETA